MLIATFHCYFLGGQITVLLIYDIANSISNKFWKKIIIFAVIIYGTLWKVNLQTMFSNITICLYTYVNTVYKVRIDWFFGINILYRMYNANTFHTTAASITIFHGIIINIDYRN